MKIFNDTSYYFGILGNPLSHTLSPLLHNSWYQDLELENAYLVFPIEKISKSELLTLSKFKFLGFSVTIPHKEAAYKLADIADPTSKAMRASNTLVIQNNQVRAFNTDGMGAVRAIREKTPDCLQGHILILGSGGSARGIAYSLLEEESVKSITISSRNQARGTEIVELLNQIRKNSSTYEDLGKVKENFKEYSLVIHTTPLGMKGKDPGPIIKEVEFAKDQALFDIVYNPLRTELVKVAEKSEARIILGSEMLLYQAVEQFKLFTGITLSESNIEAGRKRLVAALGVSETT
ncbi:shikimate dehydrogenase [Leptospira perolatii]|uniref:Shikimate dehydrogenase (NADP(+)) n=1 Tax=Leptospira perolatii TaxID=2023191 RepID=A0A2M9ZSV1_9LEPT|nr:shikimate dehydrogenase [Leptospira perolatii]PJZ68739.1 shikimate dehydrogenase [Leptospira perolatii]PJZ75094.1 shikimate dehydrogenase [Leptospira perolatii]